MSTPLVTTPGHLDHPPEPVHSPQVPTPRRVGLLDRTALHLGVALIKWGRRPDHARSAARADALRRHESARDRFLSQNLSRLL
jgi:hypothetical protein